MTYFKIQKAYTVNGVTQWIPYTWEYDYKDAQQVLLDLKERNIKSNKEGLLGEAFGHKIQYRIIKGKDV